MVSTQMSNFCTLKFLCHPTGNFLWCTAATRKCIKTMQDIFLHVRLMTRFNSILRFCWPLLTSNEKERQGFQPTFCCNILYYKMLIKGQVKSGQGKYVSQNTGLADKLYLSEPYCYCLHTVILILDVINLCAQSVRS